MTGAEILDDDVMEESMMEVLSRGVGPVLLDIAPFIDGYSVHVDGGGVGINFKEPISEDHRSKISAKFFILFLLARSSRSKAALVEALERLGIQDVGPGLLH